VPGAAAATLLPLQPGEAMPLGWLDWQPLLLALLQGIAAGLAPEQLARWWHERLVEGLVAVVLQAARERGCRQVAFSGGCFQNALLLEGCRRRLAAAGLRVFWPQQLPCNDGGLALGQLWAALGELPITTASGNPAPCAWPPPA
jgi:hydrogenase maturation protein HypF